MHKLLKTLLVFLLPLGSLQGQQFFRISADFSIKEKADNGAVNLTVGKVYYDKNQKKIIYRVSFPQKGEWVIYDTLTYEFKDNNLVKTSKSLALAEFSVFHLALSGTLDNFGLRESPFLLEKIEKEDSLLLATWIARDEKLRLAMGKVIISKKDRKLNGIAFFKPDGTLAGRQLFRKYINHKGLDFPTEIIQFQKTPKGEAKQITTFSKIVVNEAGNNALYQYKLPPAKSKP